MQRTDTREERGPYARGVKRKRELLEAVLRLLARQGVSCVTHRAVAAEAGASLRATTYYFATKDDMIREAFRFFVAQSLQRIDKTREAAAGIAPDLDAALDLIVDQVRAEAQDPNTSWAVEFELVLAVARDPSLAAEYREFQLKLDKRLREVMKRLGSPSPASHTRIVLGFLRGFELEQLSRPQRSLPAALRTLRGDLKRLLSSFR